MFERLRNDFQLAVICLLAVMAQLALMPFTIWRLLIGDWAHAIANLIVSLTALWAMLHAWRSGSCRGPGIVLSVLSVAAATFTAHLPGAVGLYWFFAALLASYLLMRRGEATALVLAALALLLATGIPFSSTLQTWSFTVSALLVALFAFSFAWRVEVDRLALERLATLDPLTCVGNRRSLDQAITRALAQARRDRTGFALAMLDLDHFKRINDRFGHEAGDQVLVDAVALLRELTRKADELFRFGGEEFVLLLSGVEDDESLRRIGDKLCASVSSHLRYAGEAITVSIGATRVAEGDSAETWLARADAAMYRAKESGRDRAVTLPASIDVL